MTENKCDLISREALIKEFERLGYTYRVTSIIDNAPTVEFCLIADIEKLTPEENKKFVNLFKKGKFKFIETAVRQQGEWVDEGVNGWKCNRCGYGVERYNNTNFCPNCGADMRGEKK